MAHKNLITELTQGKEMAVRLRTHLQPSCSAPEACFFLTEMIQTSFEKALNLLLSWNPSDSMVEQKPQPTKNKRKATTTKDVFKKRKLLPNWSEEIKVCSGTAPEGPLNDGHSWRKYGQKDIHSANFPRCYYRCTHRDVRGCLATKQVQRSDNDPNIFEVKYRGRHTCNQSSNLGLISDSNQIQIPLENNQNQQNPNPEILFNFEQHVKTENFDDVFPPFSFPSPSIGSEIGDENVFYEPMMDSDFIAGAALSAVAVSPAVSETAWDWSVYSGEDGGDMQRFPSSELSDLTEIISATTSVTNSPIGNGDWDFSLDFDQNFPFDCLDFTSF